MTDLSRLRRAVLTAVLATTLIVPSATAGDRSTSSQKEAKSKKGVRINFQLKGSTTPCGWTADTGSVFGKRNGLTYGWNFSHEDVTRDRDKMKNQLRDTLSHFHHEGVWELKVKNGLHDVHVAIGDAEYGSTHFLFVEGSPILWNQDLGPKEFKQVKTTVNVTDGKLTISQGSAPDKATRINFVKIDVPSGSSTGCADNNGPKPQEPEPGGTDGGKSGVGHRPHGLKGLKKTFGRRCNSKANDARTYYPSTAGRGRNGYVYYHSKLARKVGGRVLKRLKRDGRTKAVDYGVWGYACRLKTGGTSWSVHSWGAAIDTNTLRNPYGATKWDGRGANGKRFGRYYPNLWLAQGFYWGINFRDPMHFQFVSGY